MKEALVKAGKEREIEKAISRGRERGAKKRKGWEGLFCRIGGRKAAGTVQSWCVEREWKREN